MILAMKCRRGSQAMPRDQVSAPGASSKEGGRGGGSAGGSAMWPSTRDDGAPDMKPRFCLSGCGCRSSNDAIARRKIECVIRCRGQPPEENPHDQTLARRPSSRTRSISSAHRRAIFSCTASSMVSEEDPMHRHAIDSVPFLKRSQLPPGPIADADNGYTGQTGA